MGEAERSRAPGRGAHSDTFCLHTQAALYPKVHDLTYPLPKLDMRVHCLHGTGVDTAEHFMYDVPRFSSSDPPAPSRVRQGPGDGTVNLRSLEAGARYACISHKNCNPL